MIFGGSHPENTHRTVEIECEPGGGYLIFTPDEMARFKAGEPVKKRSGDCHGCFTIMAQIVRDKPKLRCRYSDCIEGHPVADDEEQVTCETCRKTLGLPALTEPSP